MYSFSTEEVHHVLDYGVSLTCSKNAEIAMPAFLLLAYLLCPSNLFLGFSIIASLATTNVIVNSLIKPIKLFSGRGYFQGMGR